MITLRLIEAESIIEDKIKKNLIVQINNIIKKNIKKITTDCKSLAVDWINNQPEIKSLSDGLLAGAFGIPQSSRDSVVTSIVTAINNSITVSFTPFNSNFVGSLDINFQPSDFSNLLGLDSGHVVYENGDLHWMNWLLTMGNSIIITNYKYNPIVGSGRSGLGVMSIGGSFRVPPQFAGDVSDNFVTRALLGESQEKEISKIIQGIFR